MHAVQRLRQTLHDRIHARLGGECQLDALAAQRIHRQRAVCTFRIGQRVDLLTGDRLDGLLALLDVSPDSGFVVHITFAVQLRECFPNTVVSVLERRPLVHVIGVALDGNQAGIHHFLHLSRAEVRCHGVVGILVGVLADGNADGENGRLHVVFPQHRERVRVVAQIAIVKRENDRFLGQRCTIVDVIAQLLERNRVPAGVGKRLNLFAERLRRNGS